MKLGSINTPIGKMFVRNCFDENVIKEVIVDHEYERWGDITINKGDTVVDCGGHIGSFTRLALSRGANVVSIEADRENFEVLKFNTANYGNLKLVNAILWDGLPVSFLKDEKRGELNKIGGNSPKRETVTLDNIIGMCDIDKIDLLKMDIEGAEYEVLYNFRNLKMVKQLTMEWHYGCTNMAELIIFLEKNGLEVVWSAGNGQWGKIQAKRIDEK